jgi:glutathione S-transferase
MTITLYYAPGSCAMAPFIALTEAGAAFDVKAINLAKGEQMTAEFDRVNPKHRVPVLVVDGQPITENLAIQLWIARQYPATQLLPHDPMQQILAISFLSWCGSAIHPAITPNARPQRYCDLPGSEESVRRCAQKLLAEHFGNAEQMLGERAWFFGDHFTTADAYFYWCLRRASQVNTDLSAFPRCLAHRARMEARASVQQVLAFEAETLQRFAAA